MILYQILLLFTPLKIVPLCYGADKNAEKTHVAPSLNGITQKYQHVPIQKQLQEYREIYDEILKKNPADPYNTHSPRLFEKLKNAFFLTYQYIHNSQSFDPDGTPRSQEEYLTYLHNLYQAAIQINDDKEMSPLHFERINAVCALIGTQYQRYTGKTFYRDYLWEIWEGRSFFDNEQKPEMAAESLKNGVDATISFIKKRMKNTFIGTYQWYLHKNTQEFRPMAVLYMDRDIRIGYKTFITEFFTGSYPLFLSVFSPLSVATNVEQVKQFKLRKENVHFSNTHTLFIMLAHDYEHRFVTTILSEYLKKWYPNLSWIEYLRPVYNAIKKATINEQRLLEAGLFLLTHELQRAYITSDQDTLLEELKATDVSKSFQLLKEIIGRFQAYTNNELLQRGTEQYKKYYRDNEYVLFYAKNREEKPFLPVVKINGKNKFLPIAKDEQGEPLIILGPIIMEDKLFIKVHFANNPGTTEIPYITDEKNNIILPDGWSWMPHEERKIPTDFSGQAEDTSPHKKHLYNLRQEYAKAYIKKGYDDFWNYFKELSLPLYN